MHIHYRGTFWALLIILQGILINSEKWFPNLSQSWGNKKGYVVDNMIISPVSILSGPQWEKAILPALDWVPPPGIFSDKHGNIKIFPSPFHTNCCIISKPISTSNSFRIGLGVCLVDAKLRISNNSQPRCSSILMANCNVNDKMQNLKTLQLFCTMIQISPRIIPYTQSQVNEARSLIEPHRGQLNLWGFQVHEPLNPLLFN